MQRISKYLDWLTRASGRLLTFLFLSISVAILTFLILGIPTPSPLILFFCLFIPGYSFVALVFSQLNKLEKAVASIAFSISLLAGLKSLIKTFGFVGLFSEVDVLTIFSTTLLIAKIIKSFFVKEG